MIIATLIDVIPRLRNPAGGIAVPRQILQYIKMIISSSANTDKKHKYKYLIWKKDGKRRALATENEIEYLVEKIDQLKENGEMILQ